MNKSEGGIENVQKNLCEHIDLHSISTRAGLRIQIFFGLASAIRIAQASDF